MRIPARFQDLMDEDNEPDQRVRKGNGRSGAFRSGNPDVRREVRLAKRSGELKLRRAARAVRITVKAPETALELRDMTYRNYRETCEIEGKPVRLRVHLTAQMWDRLTVNFLRHRCTTYDDLLEQSRAMPGQMRQLFNQEIKIRVLEEIGRNFPELAAECNRQRAYSGFNLEDHAGLSDEAIPSAA
jgi:hypothetical protein